ncbi:MAG TPA: hypothetical protein VMU30_04420, partial [Bacteroidota bacterium]|nr:hypothetical protein [Bacteroidota bacterium]
PITTSPIQQPTRTEPQKPQPPTPIDNRPAAFSAPRINTRISTQENNVYAAPDGSIMRSTPQGWQQRSQNTWNPAPEAPAKQAAVRDSEVRQRAAERTSNFKPAPQPAPKNNNSRDENKRR